MGLNLKKKTKLKPCSLKTEFERCPMKDPKVNEGRCRKGIEGMDNSNEGKKGGHMIRSFCSTAKFNLLSR